jgi:hypothetical protein
MFPNLMKFGDYFTEIILVAVADHFHGITRFHLQQRVISCLYFCYANRRKTVSVKLSQFWTLSIVLSLIRAHDG